MTDSTDTSAADVRAELHHLRQRNNELQLQLDKIMNEKSVGAVSHGGKQDEKEGVEMSSSSQQGGGIELTERSSGLHRRTFAAASAKENSCDNTERDPLESPMKRHGFAKTKDSDVDPKVNNGRLTPPIGETAFDNECNGYHHFSTPTGSRKSDDGSGNYYEPPVVLINGDEEDCRFSDRNNQQSNELSDDEIESDGLIDDDSHNKHSSKNGPSSPCSLLNTSASVNFPPLKEQIKDRGGWLIGLLILQSCSSFIIQYNEKFLQGHMVIVQFLTMLVGAGGNAGNQASVRVIRSLAVGTLNRHTIRPFLIEEAKMALCLSGLIGLTGFIRAAMFRTPPGETIAVTASVCAIVAISVGIGSTLPLGMKKIGIDPAHSSTSIQVIMDILGVLITVCVSSFVLSFEVFQNSDSEGG
mmetsp:Transcript_10881/g.23310  ORF Transcript_10881/g.23310 Transcript_10881/m.23310 type:complete len:413 (-) Transcript_10881:91-1329(-)